MRADLERALEADAPEDDDGPWEPASWLTADDYDGEIRLCTEFLVGEGEDALVDVLSVVLDDEDDCPEEHQAEYARLVDQRDDGCGHGQAADDAYYSRFGGFR